MIMVSNSDLQKWQKAIQGIEAGAKDLSNDEMSAFLALNDFFSNGNFVSGDSGANIKIIKDALPSHSEHRLLKAHLSIFVDLCEKYFGNTNMPPFPPPFIKKKRKPTKIVVAVLFLVIAGITAALFVNNNREDNFFFIFLDNSQKGNVLELIDGKPDYKAPLVNEKDSAYYYLGIHFGATMIWFYGFEKVNYEALSIGLEEAFKAGKEISNDEKLMMEVNTFLNSYISKIQNSSDSK